MKSKCLWVKRKSWATVLGDEKATLRQFFLEGSPQGVFTRLRKADLKNMNRLLAQCRTSDFLESFWGEYRKFFFLYYHPFFLDYPPLALI